MKEFWIKPENSWDRPDIVEREEDLPKGYSSNDYIHVIDTNSYQELQLKLNDERNNNAKAAAEQLRLLNQLSEYKIAISKIHELSDYFF